jgi:hypothetical protein
MQNACIARDHSIKNTKVKTRHHVSCAGSGRVRIVFTPELSGVCVTCDNKNKKL